jgi:flagellar hook protein FlgE
MMRSMMSAVTGLRAQQTAMDVIGNNIANVNTAGFKSSSAQFEDLFYQTLSGATEETNPSQVGYGAQVSGISKNMSSTGATQTDNPWQLYIDGGGYFTIADAAGDPAYYTRVGNFTFDKTGHLVDSSGNNVMGTVDNGATQIPINIDDTTNTYFTTTDGTKTVMTDAMYNAMGNISFNSDGSIAATYNNQNGVFTDADGNPIKVAIATFVNEYGLSQAGNNDFESTQSSGTANYTTALNGNTTRIRGNELEMSNVDVANEFTNMIVTQRGFQANSRVITTSDTLLEELINLKRS